MSAVNSGEFNSNVQSIDAAIVALNTLSKTALDLYSGKMPSGYPRSDINHIITHTEFNIAATTAVKILPEILNNPAINIEPQKKSKIEEKMGMMHDQIKEYNKTIKNKESLPIIEEYADQIKKLLQDILYNYVSKSGGRRRRTRRNRRKARKGKSRRSRK
jgi:hypothetical protein